MNIDKIRKELKAAIDWSGYMKASDWAVEHGSKLLDEITSLRAERDKAVEGLKPFAEIAEWADRNGHNLHDFDMLIRHIAGTKSGQFAGHLGVQSEQFIAHNLS